ncbi:MULTISPECIES: molecular chaperone HtpG [unclassified Oceanispirochaeta]|uniref:molecular chaperone HtpG n=1 Tax=unclassified Oceanispirochaeta TaxID=2635722 RepID=UPI000E093785|nr:molecular chaperone HtpG [Oceanispirochaeta sp. M1]MBF9015379.1 molecular chaperone HtpG [Oceanispirochaeta sp. M2]NPD71838.1 molecular chaperone HtpG [Oceanispirochaeta sp. M1]RDG32649.1 molecular chaperone HtpG [Oceanispirochaeta sp. M1]
MSKRKFKTEVNQLLDLLIHSLYSHSEIFLRELISNSSDALDKLKYLTLTDDAFKNLEFDPRVDIIIDKNDKKTLTIKDNGIGMSEQDLVDSLGTIARSGTKNFLSQISGDDRKDSNLIGQFGVGFYSIFMVADKVDVISRKAGEDSAWKWSSDGREGFSLDSAEREEGNGTSVILHLNDTGKEYANRYDLEQIIKKYSNHIAFPIFLHYESSSYEGEGDDKKEVKEDKIEQINAASALWKRSTKEIKDEEYNEFFKSISNDMDDPLHRIHTRAEGTLEYTTLFFIPKKAPFDMYQADYKPGVKLYVRRVFITDDDKELLPTYLRFIRGVIDSEDLPLNVSREILQKNKVLASIRNASVKKILSELKKLSDKEEEYKNFIEQYNRPLKEGIYSDYANKDDLMELVRYKSTSVEGWTSLAAYVDRMTEDQKSIYFITGDNEGTLRNSPLLEAYKKKGIEVLIMDDEIDEIVAPMMGSYKEKEMKGVNKSGSADDLKTDEDKEKEKSVEPLLKKIKDALGEEVKDVVASSRLHESPSCIVADENDPTAQMQQMLKAMGQTEMPEIKPILEVNPDHAIVKQLQDSSDMTLLEDVSHLLLDQAILAEGAPLKDPHAFAKRLNRVLEKAL